ncbi:MAG: hypothetical protein KBA61_12765 [Spirochaetes bacterium]|nr:hypothetical protein [Spirochaetota bacterium]
MKIQQYLSFPWKGDGNRMKSKRHWMMCVPALLAVALAAVPGPVRALEPVVRADSREAIS